MVVCLRKKAMVRSLIAILNTKSKVFWLCLGLLGFWSCQSQLKINPQKLLVKKHFSWNTDSTAHFIYHLQKPSYSDSNKAWIKKRSELAYRSVLDLLGLKGYEGTFHLFVIQSGLEMKKLVGHRGNGSAFPKSNTLAVVVNRRVNALTNHELTHIVAYQTLGPTETWLDEGLAVYSDGNWWGNDLHALTKYLAEKDQMPSISELTLHFRDLNELVSYPVAGSFVRFLIEKYGKDKLWQIWKKGWKHAKNIYGLSMEELEKNWQQTYKNAEPATITYPDLSN